MSSLRTTDFELLLFLNFSAGVNVIPRMTAAIASQDSTIWLRDCGYRVMALNPGVTGFVGDLR